MTTTVNELYSINAIELVNLLQSDKPIKAVWVYQDKIDTDVQYIRTKSRICPQGFRFRPGIEYDPNEVASYVPHVSDNFDWPTFRSLKEYAHYPLGCDKLFLNVQCTTP
jgi:Reverse transcriptase (RNA-dependent DNA polymerase)